MASASSSAMGSSAAAMRRVTALLAACAIVASAPATGRQSDRPPASRQAVAHQDVTVKAADGRLVSVRIFAPARGCQGCPLLIFSHGTYSDFAHYDVLLNAWAAHGMVVAAPLHTDSEQHPDRTRYSMLDSRRTRIGDMAAVDAALRPGARPLLKGISFSGRLFAAGHSYGGVIAQVMGGAKLDRDAEVKVTRNWRLPQAVVALSPSGQIPDFVSTAGWAAMTRPTLVVTGTTDITPGYFDQYEVHLSSYRAAPAGVGYALVFDGMDHAFNGAYWKVTPDGVRSAPAIARLNASIFAFLDAAARNAPLTPVQWRRMGGAGVRAEAK